MSPPADAPPPAARRPAAELTVPGFVEWFRIGDEAHVHDAIAGLTAMGATRLRTQVSWADHHAPGGAAWYDWLLPRLGEAFDLLPCVHYTPPSLSRTGRSSGPPRRLLDYADFVDGLLDRHGHLFEAVELWNEPNNLLDWDWREDPTLELFCEMVGAAAHWAQVRGFRTVLGGPSPFDAKWYETVGERGLLSKIDAAGLHGFPGTWDSEAGGWNGWAAQADRLRAILDRHAPEAEIWITETGHSTWAHDEIGQARRFLDALRAPADRVYWYAWRDIPARIAVQEGPRFDARHYHLGVVDVFNRPKLLARALAAGGPQEAERLVELAAPSLRNRAARPLAIAGGCGFVGANLAESYLAEGETVALVDNLSRPGVEDNLAWLRDRHGARAEFRPTDLRDAQATVEALEDARAIFHLAGQTAVTTSLEDPAGDFEANARGTLNLLEAARAAGQAGGEAPPVIFASTNKVYGALGDVVCERFPDRTLPADADLRARGVDERRPLDFCTPYGCSKGVADQYALDYAASFGLPTAVLRMSCIYGPRQFGTEDQGWVAHFLLCALRGEPVTIFGDGRQVRDVLHADDACAAYRACLARIDAVAGRAFNLGGGPRNAISLVQLLDEIARLSGRPVQVERARVRAGDQAWFVADAGALERATGWRARVGWREGVEALWRWLAENRLPGGRVAAAVPAALEPRSERA